MNSQIKAYDITLPSDEYAELIIENVTDSDFHHPPRRVTLLEKVVRSAAAATLLLTVGASQMNCGDCKCINPDSGVYFRSDTEVANEANTPSGTSYLGRNQLIASALKADPRLSTCNIPDTLQKATSYINGKEYDAYTEPGSSFRIVCQQPCTIPEPVLIAKYAGAKKAIAALVDLIGIDVHPTQKPVDIHLNGDNECGSAADMIKNNGFLSGFAGKRYDGKGYLCLFDSEKKNRMLEFNTENASKMEDQMLLIHEYGHEIFYVRAFTSPESFVVPWSFYVTGFWDGNGVEPANFQGIKDACDTKYNLGGSNSLIHLLCKNHGFKFSEHKAMMKQIDKLYETGQGEDLIGVLRYSDPQLAAMNLIGEVSDKQIITIIKNITGQDVTNTFVSVGWQP